MSVIAYHVREICSFHFAATPNPGLPQSIISVAFGAGAYGVQLFFAISGFVLALPFAKQYFGQAPPVELRAYYIRRITRLEPPYIIHLVFVFVLCWAVLRHLPSHSALYHNGEWAGYALSRLFVSLFYSNGLLFGDHPYPNIVLWTLEVEVQFYIAAPFIAVLFAIRRPLLRRIIIVGLILIMSLVSYAIGQAKAPSYALGASLVGNLHFFLIGFLVCDWFLTTYDPARARSRAWDFVFCAGLVAFLLFHEHPQIMAAYPLFILVWHLAAFRGVLCNTLLSNRWVTTVGGMCYTVYMYHWFMISGLVRVTERLRVRVFWADLLIQFTVMSVVIVFLCAILFVLFERPFMQRGWHLKVAGRIARFGKSASPSLEGVGP